MSMLRATIRLSEFFEDVFMLIRRDALTVVTHGDCYVRGVALNDYANSSIGFCKFHGVADQGFENAANDIGIARDDNRIGWDVATQGAVLQERRKSSRGCARNLCDIIPL